MSLVDVDRARGMIFGLALILMMRFRPEGLLSAGHIQAEMHGDTPPTTKPGGQVK